MILHTLRTAGISTAFPGEVAIDFDALGPGLIALVGGNGGGKTTLLELSGPGTTHRWLPSYNEGLAAHLHPAARQAFSELEFSLAGHRYRVRDVIDAAGDSGKGGKGEAWLWRDGETIAGEKVTLVDRALAEVLPPLELFLASNFACQSREGSFFTLSKAEKKALFVRFLGLERLERMAKAAGARAAALLARLEGVRAEMAAAAAKVERLDEIEQQLASGRAVLEQLDATRAETAAAQADAAAALATAREALAAAEATAAAGAARQVALAEDIERSAEDLDAAAARVATLEAAIAAAASVHAAAARVAELDAERRTLTEAIDARRAALAPLNTEAAELKGQIDGLLADHGRLKAEQAAAAEAAGRLEQAGDVAGALEAARGEHGAIAAAVAARQAAIPRLEAADEAERTAATRRTALLARRADLEPRTGLLAGIEVEHPMCGVCPLTADAREVSARIADIDAELAALTPPTDATEVLRTARRELAGAEQTLRMAARRVATAEAAIAALGADRAAAGRAGAITEAVNANVATGKASRGRQQDLAAQRTVMQAEIDERVTRRAALDEERAPLAALAARRADVEAAEAQIDEARAARTRLTERLAGLRAEREAFVAVDLTAEHEAVAATGASVTKLDRELAAIDGERAPLAETQQRLLGERDALGDVAGALATLRARERELATDAADWSHLERAFGPNGVQALSIDAAGPGVSAIANELLASCYGNRFQLRIDTTEPAKSKRGVMKEIFDVAILDGEAGREGKQGSGGEMVIVDTALRLALAIYTGQQAGGTIATLWLDEMTGALSPENASRYVRMLRRARTLGAFHQILLVSHLPSVWQQADARLYVAGGRVTTTPPDDLAERVAAQEAA